MDYPRSLPGFFCYYRVPENEKGRTLEEIEKFLALTQCAKSIAREIKKGRRGSFPAAPRACR